DFLEPQLPQLKQLVLLVKHTQVASLPVSGRQGAATDRAALSLIPLRQSALDILRRGIDLRQALLTTLPSLRPARAGFQAGVFLAAQCRPERELAIKLNIGALA